MPNFLRRMRSALSTNHRAASISAPFFNVVEQSGTAPAEVWLYGEVVNERPIDWWTGEPEAGMCIAVDDVLAELERVRDATEITIHLNSSGGDLIAGVTIHNLLRSFSGRKTVIVDGLAASAASVIMCAGDVIQVHPGSMVMIHNASTLLWGYYSASDLRGVLNDLEACELSILRIYGERTGKDENEIQALIDATTWYVGADAIEGRFADELIERDGNDGSDAENENDSYDVPIAARLTPDGECLMVAGVPHSIAALGQLPPWLADKSQIPDVAAAAHGYIPTAGGEPDAAHAALGSTPQAEEEGGMQITNAAELRSTYPELVAAIESDAVTKERERIRSITEIADSIRNPELVNRAMFDDPMTAADLALEAVRADATAASNVLNAIDEDAATAIDGDVLIAPIPVATEDEDVIEAENEAEFMARVHGFYAAAHSNTEKGVQ